MSNEVAIVEQTPNNSLVPFSSIQGADLETRFTLAAAVMGATPLADHKGVPFNLAHIVRQPVEVVNEQTGVVSKTFRTTLITDDGRALAATSRGIDIAVDNILATLGNPAQWSGASFPFIAEERGSGTRKFLTLVPVVKAAKK